MGAQQALAPTPETALPVAAQDRRNCRQEHGGSVREKAPAEGVGMEWLPHASLHWPVVPVKAQVTPHPCLHRRHTDRVIVSRAKGVMFEAEK